jgi:hypothetical protein
MNVLALDVGGIPRQWLSLEQAILYQAKKQVAWSLGETIATFRGGIQNDGTISLIETPSIIAVRGGDGFNPAKFGKVVLSNRTLFGRDRHVCAYCGNTFTSTHLSRDHIVPVSRGGENKWMNVVTACKGCNSRKSNKTLKEARLELLYIPYEPNYYEAMVLQNRNILVDQMDYLKSGIPKHSRVV